MRLPLYTIEVANIPADRLHYTLRNWDYDYPSSDFIYTLYLSALGRLCTHRTAVYLDTEELAQQLLDYYKPQLDKRSYDGYKISVVRIPRPDKYMLRWAIKSKPKVLDVLGLTAEA